MRSINTNIFLRDNLISKPGSETPGEWLPLWMHSLDAAGVMEKLITQWLPLNVKAELAAALTDPGLKKLCIFSAYVHDIGQATALHQASAGTYLPGVRERVEAEGVTPEAKDSFLNSHHTPHHLAGEAILISKGIPAGVCCAIGSHHGKPRAKKTAEDLLAEQFTSSGRNYFGYAPEDSKEKRTAKKAAWNAVWDILVQDALGHAGYGSVDEIPEIDVQTQVILSALIVMAEWIASNTEYFPPISTEDYDSDILSNLYPQRIEDAWSKLDFRGRWAPERFETSDTALKNHVAHHLAEIQSRILSVVNDCKRPGIFILEAPAAVCTAETSLAMAQSLAVQTGAGGVFFAAETETAANSIYPLFEDWAQKQTGSGAMNIRLLHDSARLNRQGAHLSEQSGSDGGVFAHPWFERWKQAPLSNFVLTTLDEFAMAGAKQKYFMLRHLGLAGKVVILTGTNPYDTHQNVYLDRALRWMGQYKTPAILLCSALPEQRRVELISAYTGKHPDDLSGLTAPRDSYPLLTWTDGGEVKQQAFTAPNTMERSIRIELADDTDVVRLLQKATAQGGCTGLICNTARKAQELADTVRAQIPNAEIILLHEHLLLPDREGREKLIAGKLGQFSTPESRSKVIVIGTKLLEQIRGIQFDHLISDFCPVDILLQRLDSLLARNSADVHSHAVLLGAYGEPDPSAISLYGEWTLLKTRQILPKAVSIPGDVASLTRHLHEDQPEDMIRTPEIRAIWDDHERRISNGKNKAAFRLPPPESFSASFSPQTIAGILETGIRDATTKAKAVVRGREDLLAVLLMVRHEDNTVGFLPWQYGGKHVDTHTVPAEKTCREILSQRLVLPATLTREDRATAVISHLEEGTEAAVPVWQHSGFLRDELVLFLDDTLKAELDEFCIQYDRESGLTLSLKEGDIFGISRETV